MSLEWRFRAPSKRGNKMICKDQDIGKLIGSYELGLLSEEEKRMFEDHLLNCVHCFQSLYRTSPIATMIREMRLAPNEAIELADEEEEESLPEPPSRGGLIHILRKPWVYAAAGVSVVLLIAVIVLWLQGPGKEIERLRGHDEISILVVSPVGEVTAISELRWKAIKGVQSYEVNIYTEVGDLVWKESVDGSTAILPDYVHEKLIPGRSFNWQVEALTAEGDRLKSQLIQFTIRE
jgi:hypothetical protein